MLTFVCGTHDGGDSKRRNRTGERQIAMQWGRGCCRLVRAVGRCDHEDKERAEKNGAYGQTGMQFVCTAGTKANERRSKISVLNLSMEPK